MTAFIEVAARAFSIVLLTSMNVRLIARKRYAWAFVTGFGISALWWTNSAAARTDFAGAWFVYGLFAGLATLCGMWIGGRL